MSNVSNTHINRMLESERTLEQIKEYYGKVLQSSTDLKTSACCIAEEPPEGIKAYLDNIPEEVVSRYYGCGLVAPQSLQGQTVLDLGSGSGHDCYLLSQMVGPNGRVIGVDMTEEQLAVSTRYSEGFQKKHGTAPLEFHHGYIENLHDLGIKDDSIDIVVSNCVINLSPAKDQVLKEVFRVLKPGGEMYFSDVYADRRIPEALAKDPILYGECLSGALYHHDFIRLARSAGFMDPRLVQTNAIDVNTEIKEKTGNIQFSSATYRLFKLKDLEDLCEDYGQSVVYRGGIKGEEAGFQLDDHHYFEQGKQHLVCGNTFMMLHNSRFRPHFDFFGDFSRHYGIFPDCQPEQTGNVKQASIGSCC